MIFVCVKMVNFLSLNGEEKLFLYLTIKKNNKKLLNPCISVIDCRRRQETVEIRERRVACKYVLSWSHA